MTIPSYDVWKLSAPENNEIGSEEGQPCNRFPEPDEDAPRGHMPTRCDGEMVYAPVENCSCHINPPCWSCENNPLVCSVCGEPA